MSDPIIARIEARRRQQTAAVVLEAQDTTPDAVAAQQSLAKRAGLPLGVVRSDPDSVRRQVEREELDGLHRNAPELAAWATRPDNYAVARDDLGALGKLADVGRAFAAAIPRTIGSTLTGGAELLDAVGRRGARSIEALFGLEADQVPLDQRIGSPMNVARNVGGRFKDAANAMDVPEERQNLATDIAGGVGQLGTQVVQALVAAPTLVPSLLSQGADQMAERVEAARMEETLAGDLAILGGSAVTGLTEKYGLDKLLNRVPPKVRNAVLRRIADVAAGGSIEAAQEVTEGIAQDVLTKALLDDDHEVGGAILRQAEAAGGAGAIARLVVQIAGGRRAHAQAQAERETLTAAVNAAAPSRTRTRAPEQFEQAVNAMAPDRMVFAPVDALAQHFAGTDPAAAINDLAGNANAYAEAVATGADVAIPLSRYLSRIGTEAHTALSGRVRLQPAEEVRPDTILPERAQIAQQIAEGLAEARTTSPTIERIRAEYRPLLTDPAQADDWPGYQAAVERAKASTIAERVAERERIAAIATDKRLRRETQAAVEVELRSHPVYRAERLLRSGKAPDGTPAVNPVKLDHATVVAVVGEEAAAKLKGMTRKHKGVSPDEAAVLLGYPSGAKLLHDMTTAPAFADMVQMEVAARVQERATPQETHADDAQAEVLLREVQAIEARNGGVRTHDAALREIARRLVADKDARSLNPQVYRQAEAKAAREAYQAAAKGDLREAGQARRRQLQNLYLYREARNAREEVTSAGKRFAQLSKRSSLARIGKAGSDYQEQLRALLGRFDFRALTGPQIDARTSLAKWIKAKEAEGVTIELPPSIADEAFRTPFRKMKVGEIRDLRSAVDQIVHAANEANTLRANGERFDRMLTDEAMALSVRDGGTVRPTRTGDRTLWDKTREELWHARAMTGAATDLARELDGFKDGGAVWSHTVGIIRDANDRTQGELDKAAKALAEIKLKHYSKAELRSMDTRRHFPEIGDWSKGRILALGLNWGNAGNREAILTQVDNRLTPEHVGRLLGTLDARDWAFVQDTWKLIDGYWPAIAEAQRRRRGIVPEKVPPVSFGVITSDGQELTIPGGYYPLKYGGSDAKSLAQEASTLYEDVRTGKYAKASTKDGHTIERVGSGGKEVRLDLGVIDGHLRNVVRDLYMGDAVNMVHTTLHGTQFIRAANDVGKAQVIHGLELWLRDVATGEIGLFHWHEKAVRLLRSNATAAVLTYRPTSAALQITGAFQSAVVLESPRAMLDGLARYLRRPLAMSRYAREASPFLARRLDTHVEAVERVRNAEAGRYSAAQADMVKWGYWMMGRMQGIVDVSTWIAAERQGLGKFNGDIRKARRYADDVVSRAQGSQEFLDKNAIQRGTLGDNVRQSEYVRATTALMGYLIAKQNVGLEVVRKASAKDVRGAAKLAGNLMLLYTIEGMVASLVRGQFFDDEEKDGSRFDDVMKAAGMDTLGTMFGAVPGVAQLATELRGYTDRGQVSELWHAVSQAMTQAEQGEADKAAAKAAIKLGGLTTGLPSSQVNKTIEAVAKGQNGEDVTPWEYLNGPKARE